MLVSLKSQVTINKISLKFSIFFFRFAYPQTKLYNCDKIKKDVSEAILKTSHKNWTCSKKSQIILNKS